MATLITSKSHFSNQLQQNCSKKSSNLLKLAYSGFSVAFDNMMLILFYFLFIYLFFSELECVGRHNQIVSEA